jgi:coenzyme PQQ synthesis protein D (PqqD)
MTIPFDSRLSVPSGVLVSEVGLESVFLNLKSESYFGLDEVGTRMWKLLTESDTVQLAFDQILTEFNIDEAQLRLDLDELIQKLIANGLVEVSTPAA